MAGAPPATLLNEGTSFSKLKSAEILLKEDGTTEMIRRAETPEDYFATIKGFNF